MRLAGLNNFGAAGPAPYCKGACLLFYRHKFAIFSFSFTVAILEFHFDRP
jgi:hypothetical protein